MSFFDGQMCIEWRLQWFERCTNIKCASSTTLNMCFPLQSKKGQELAFVAVVAAVAVDAAVAVATEEKQF